MVESIAAVAAQATNIEPSKADNALGKFSSDFESFLKIFVTQLQNQDPLEPQDSSDFTGQIAQFSAVEQSVQTNKNLENILSIFQNDNNASLVSYSGKFVEVVGDTVDVTTDGAGSTFSYVLDEPARAATVSIFDDQNNLVYSAEALTDAGQNYITWEGKDNAGNLAPAGKYRVQVDITDQDNNPQNVATIVKGRVDGVNLEGEPLLLVNGKNIPLDNVKFVGEA